MTRPGDRPSVMAADEITVAIPRNYLHVKLLQDNYPDIDRVVYRDEYFHGFLEERFPGRVMFIDREQRPDRDDWRLDRVWRSNKAYYRRVLETFKKMKVGRLILFLENEPLEVMLMDHYGMERTELWEEGVMHYVDMFDPLLFRFRRLAQILVGFYPGHPLRTRIDRSKVTVRDRFVERNLELVLPEGRMEPRRAVAFLSNVLVEDKLITEKDYVAALKRLVSATDLPVVYLPHPRETPALVERVVAAVDCSRLTIERDVRGAVAHCMDYDYSAYLSPFSTTLLDLGRFGRSFWMPAMFGLKSYQRALGGVTQFPVTAPDTWGELEAAILKVCKVQDLTMQNLRPL